MHATSTQHRARLHAYTNTFIHMYIYVVVSLSAFSPGRREAQHIENLDTCVRGIVRDLQICSVSAINWPAIYSLCMQTEGRVFVVSILSHALGDSWASTRENKRPSGQGREGRCSGKRFHTWKDRPPEKADFFPAFCLLIELCGELSQSFSRCRTGLPPCQVPVSCLCASGVFRLCLSLPPLGCCMRFSAFSGLLDGSSASTGCRISSWGARHENPYDRLEERRKKVHQRTHSLADFRCFQKETEAEMTGETADASDSRRRCRFSPTRVNFESAQGIGASAALLVTGLQFMLLVQI